MLAQPMYSLYMVPCDLFLLPRLKKTMQGSSFVTTNEITTELQKEMNTTTKSEFHKCIPDWRKYWQMYYIWGGLI